MPTDRTGRLGPTPGQARGPGWRRSSYGLYVPAEVDATRPEQRALEQSMRVPAGGVSGWAALRLHGARFFDGLMPDGVTPRPVLLVDGSAGKVRATEEAAVSHEILEISELVRRHGVACTVVHRAVFDEMRAASDVREAAVVADMAMAAELTSLRRLRDYVDQRRSWKRSVLARRALALADERSRSPQETRYRLVWVLDAGLPHPRVNQPVWDLAGRLLGIVDLLDEETGLVGEFDGADHRKAARHTSDLSRQESLERAGLEVCRVTGLDLLHPERVVERIHFHRARARDSGPGCWTTTPPPGWEEDSLDDRLEEREFRARWHAEHEREVAAARRGLAG